MTFRHEARRPAATWVVVADRARTRIFAGEWPELMDLQEVKDLVHPESKLHQRDVEDDGPGRFSESAVSKHSGEPRTDFKHRTATEFARDVCRALQKGKDENAYGRLIVIAPALFLGALRDGLPEPVRQMIVADLDKELSLADVETIAATARDLVSKGQPL
jgi:protein required for attachment to host cells